MEQENRNFFLDISKGIAIFLMLWGHCVQYCVTGSNIVFWDNAVFKVIYSFHMPLFMLISGYLFFYSFKKRNLHELLGHRTQSLLQPIIFCSFFNYLATDMLFGMIQGDFGAIFDGKWLHNLPSLWFLWSVLSASLVTAVICKKIKSVYVQILLFFICIPIVALFPNLNMNLYMYPYFILGFYFAQYKDKISFAVHRLKYISLPLFPLMLCFYEKKHYIYVTGLLPNADFDLSQMLIIDTFRWLIGLVGSVFALTLLHIIYNHIIIKSNKRLISTAISKIGKNSLQIYALSVPFLSVYLSFFFEKALSFFNIDNIFAKNEFVYNYIFTFLLAVIYSFVLYGITKLLKKLKITNIMFGK